MEGERKKNIYFFSNNWKQNKQFQTTVEYWNVNEGTLKNLKQKFFKRLILYLNANCNMFETLEQNFFNRNFRNP